MEVRLEDLKVCIGAREIVHGFTMAAAGQQMVGLIGPNGSGKSTLLKAVYRVLRPSGGAIYLDGRPLDSMSLRTSAQKMGVMAQNNDFSFDFTVEKMVCMGRTPYKRLLEADNEADAAAVERAIQAAGIGHLRRRMFSTLSGGEKQRVLVARALAQDTPCLILDEPTNHLDITYQLQLMDIVRGLDRTVIAAIHDLNIAAMYCDRLYAVKDGEIVGSGTPEQVLTPEFIRRVYEVEARTLTDEDGRLHILYCPPRRAAGRAPAEERTASPPAPGVAGPLPSPARRISGPGPGYTASAGGAGGPSAGVEQKMTIQTEERMVF